MLKPQDIVVLLKVHTLQDCGWIYSHLASSLHMSSSEVHAALKRCDTSGLYDFSAKQVKQHNLFEFLVHGIKYVFPVKPGALTRGIPTAHSAEPLKNLLNVAHNDVYVWSAPDGTIKGESIIPLYKTVPKSVENDFNLHELLSLVDGIRVGRVREQHLASLELKARLTA
jgi:hypothetical protein